MQRRLTPELMDDPAVDRADLVGALAYLRRLNKRLGGTRALLAHLERWSARWPKGRPITMLDVGTGSGDIPAAVVAWGRARGVEMRITGIDLHETTVALAREHVAAVPGVEIIRADALRLRELFAAEQFDYVHAGLFLHHLKDIEVLTVLAGMNRVARAGLIWNDLVRSRLRLVYCRLGLIGAPAIVQHDARVSIQAGFTRREVEEIGARLGLDYCRWRCPWLWYRFTFAGEKPGAWRG